MPEINPGSKVVVETVDGETLERRAITEVVEGDDFEVVWVCTEEEWQAAQSEGREPEGIPWPAEDVEATNRAQTA